MDDHLAALDSLHTAWRHEGVAADAVRSLKYRRSTAVVSRLADVLAASAPAADVVTWCPASRARRGRRGFDQSELLARAVAHRLGLPCRSTLRRLGRSSQTGRDRDARLVGPQLAGRRRLRRSPRVLLIDDVTTTGATLGRAAQALRSAGAAEVHGLVATRAERRALATR